MKYKCGDCLLLNNKKTVSVVTVDEENKAYIVVDVNNEKDCFIIKEKDVFMYLT